ncbi:hypothetical protein [Bradyrhizobium oligotrophicum]|uniref:hypothetical protein n=1 Tax=Bradyrhizobium oligotrophicum TaxID=44255 RepID=UPI003EB8B31A
MGTVNHEFRKNGRGIFFRSGLDRGDRVERPDEINLSAHPHSTCCWKAQRRRAMIRECPPVTATCAGTERAALALIARKVVAEQPRHVDDPEFPPLAIV